MAKAGHNSKASIAALKDRLSRYRQINISVVGRKSGKWSSRPVWFVLDGDAVHLVPVQGADTQWYRNLLEDPSIHISAREAEGEFHAVPVKDANAIAEIVESFREKYSAEDIKKYYSKLNAAVAVELK